MPYIENENLAKKSTGSKPNRRRDHVLKIRLTVTEFEEISNFARKNRMTKTDSILNAIRNHNTIIINEMPEILYELRKQGTNLNQSVKLAHQSEGENLKDLVRASQACERAYQDLYEFCVKWNIKLDEN